MLNSIDLFSGLGGISHSLRGFVKPLAYCDIDPICRTTIEARMATGDLPIAPVLRDIRDTKAILAATAGEHVDMIISSSSCVGFSNVGGRKGLNHPETELFLDVLDLLKVVKAPMLFMENVGAILTSNGGKDYKAILRRFAKMGYRVAWCVLTAEHVGAWHRRRRWYALAYKPNAMKDTVLRLPIAFPSIKPFKWSKSAMPEQRLAKPKPSCVGAADVTSGRNRRMKMLGNAVVPDCCRLAFIYLFSGGKVEDITVRRIKHAEFEAENSPFRFVKSPMVIAAFPSFGVSSLKTGAPHSQSKGPIQFEPVMLNIRIDPSRGVGGNRKDAIKHPIIMERFMTPRAQNTAGGCKAATQRCLGDLGTQLRFMKGASHVNGHVNPRFVEFLMGYPKDWTDMYLSLKHPSV